jgi:hypothetical protein
MCTEHTQYTTHSKICKHKPTTVRQDQITSNQCQVQDQIHTKSEQLRPKELHKQAQPPPGFFFLMQAMKSSQVAQLSPATHAHSPASTSKNKQLGDYADDSMAFNLFAVRVQDSKF